MNSISITNFHGIYILIPALKIGNNTIPRGNEIPKTTKLILGFRSEIEYLEKFSATHKYATHITMDAKE